MISSDAQDRDWMLQALALAGLGEGWTAPNPQVGCVLVRDGELVGAGYHHSVGKPHAEVAALDAAGDRAKGATVYVNLEPCAHQGRTPPCCDALIAAGVARVVAAIQDPNPRVDGQGFDRLRAAGVSVEVGLLAEESRRLNRPFFHWQRTGMPLVTLKAALSLDGMLSAADGESKWITGPESRRFAHRLRFRHDAILVGAETVRRDNPQLDVRLPGISAPRLRAVISASLELDPASKLFHTPERGAVRVYTSEPNAQAGAGSFGGGVELVGLPAASHGEGICLKSLLQHLGQGDVQSLLVEGGGRLQGGLLEAGLAQRVALFGAPKILGQDGGTPWLPLRSVGHPRDAWSVRVHRRLPLGRDQFLWGDLEPAAGVSQERSACSQA